MIALLIALAMLVGQVGTPLYSGDANYANPSHGSNYLAMRLPRGTVVEICGAGTCKRMVVNDYGPVLSTGDIADIALVKFAAICGWSVPVARRMGECPVTVEELDAIPLPPTDTEPSWWHIHEVVR